jgi:ribosome-binding ATPase YchF (GTP1/OBG family)
MSDNRERPVGPSSITYEDFVACGGEQRAKEAGRVLVEGADCLVQDRDSCFPLQRVIPGPSSAAAAEVAPAATDC